MRIQFLTSLFVLFSSLQVCVAEKAGKNIFHTYQDNADWSCSPEKVLKLLVDSQNKEKNVLPVCLYKVKCEKVRGQAEAEVDLRIMCKLAGNQCLDLNDCAKELPEYEIDEMGWKAVELDPQPADGANVLKFGDKCQYVETKPTIIYRQLPNQPANTPREKIKSDTMCASPVKNCRMPEGLKGSFLATCDSGHLKTGKKEISCPPPQDCLARPIPLQPAFTISQAAELSSSAGRPTSAPVNSLANSKATEKGAPDKK